MARVPGPTLQDLATLGDRFTDVVLNVAKTTLRSAARELTSSPTPDDIGKMPTWWVEHVDVTLMPALAESFWHGVNVVHAGVAHSAQALTVSPVLTAAGIELFPDDNPGPATPEGLPPHAALIPRVPNQVAEVSLELQRNHLVGIGDELWANARTELIAGVHAGEGVAKLQERVRGSLDVSAPRAGVVARTEVNGAVNAGSLAEMREIGLPATKEWIATAGARTRASHHVVDGQKVPLDGTFLVGGHHLDRPHDPGAPAGEVINCRCTLGYEVVDDDLRALVGPPETLVPPATLTTSSLTEQQMAALDPASKKSEVAIRKELEKTQGGRNVLSLIKRFTETRGGVVNMRKQVAAYLEGDPPLSAAVRRRVEDFVQAVNHYPEDQVPQLYRGFGVKPDPTVDVNAWFDAFEERYATGRPLDLNMSSFTSSERKAEGFMRSPNGTSFPKGIVQVKVVVEGPIHALPVERLSKFASEKEWIAGGQFKITRLEKPEGKRGYYVIHVRQVDVLGSG